LFHNSLIFLIIISTIITTFFFIEKLAEATRKYAALQSELKTALEMQQGSGKNKGKASAKPILPARKLRDLKLAFSEFYLSLILLQNYQNLNHTGFRKILKKHDKVYVIILLLLFQVLICYVYCIILSHNITYSLCNIRNWKSNLITLFHVSLCSNEVMM